MKIYIIKASAQSAFKDYKQAMGAPPQSINALAAAAPEWATVKILDETSQAPANEQESADLVVICMSTPDALRAINWLKYSVSGAFRLSSVACIPASCPMKPGNMQMQYSAAKQNNCFPNF
ncbi:hypothetical protein [Aliamphritea spongicola]|nr:hypothetical protein [Aliamphritea spongicola]